MARNPIRPPRLAARGTAPLPADVGRFFGMMVEPEKGGYFLNGFHS